MASNIVKDVLSRFIKQTTADIEQVTQSQDNIQGAMDDYLKALDGKARTMIQEATKNYLDTSAATLDRQNLYQLYDEMDDSYSAYVSAALDMMSDDATQADIDTGEVLRVMAKSKKIEKELNDFITKMGIEDKLPGWARLIAKYGDLPVVVMGSKDDGITVIDDTVHPENFERIHQQGVLLGFRLQGYNVSLSEREKATADIQQKMLPPWGVVHFKLKGSSVVNQGNTMNGSGFKVLDTEYGQSILYPARRAFKELELIETAILLYRLTNSIKKTIYLVDVGKLDFDKALSTIRHYEELLSKRKTIDLRGDNNLTAKKNIPSYSEDVFLPIAGEKGIQIEETGGNVDIKEAMDLQYALNKFCASIKFPKAYLSFEDSLNSRSTLIQLDIRYARTVAKIQHCIIAGLYRLFQIHLAYKGIELDEELDIIMTPVSAIEEEARSEKLRNRIDYARDMIQILKDFDEAIGESEGLESYDKKYLLYYTVKDRLQLPDEILKKLLRFNYTKYEDPDYRAEISEPGDVEPKPEEPGLPRSGFGGKQPEEEAFLIERILRKAPDCRYPAGAFEWQGGFSRFFDSFTVGRPERKRVKVIQKYSTLKG